MRFVKRARAISTLSKPRKQCWGRHYLCKFELDGHEMAIHKGIDAKLTRFLCVGLNKLD